MNSPLLSSIRFHVISLFPEMIEAMTSTGIIGQARQKNLIQVQLLNPRDFTLDVHRTVDDRPFGGGDGMVMLAEPLEKALSKVKQELATDSHEIPWVVYLSPQARPLNQTKVMELVQKKEVILICGRYGGIDQRFINLFIDEEISIGDYVLSGGELAAGVVIDAVARQIPGVLGHENSADQDSFSKGLQGMLEAPSYTRPRVYQKEEVPEILLGGHHQKIQEWKRRVSILTTLSKRADLICDLKLDPEEVKKIKKFFLDLSIADKEVLGLAALTLEDLEQLHSHDSQF